MFSVLDMILLLLILLFCFVALVFSYYPDEFYFVAKTDQRHYLFIELFLKQITRLLSKKGDVCSHIMEEGGIASISTKTGQCLSNRGSWANSKAFRL